MTRPTPAGLLGAWLGRQLPEAAAAWLNRQLERLASAAGERELYTVLGLVPRKLGRADLRLDPDDLAQAERARCGWDPRGWSVDQAARILILLRAGGTGEVFAARFAELCRTAEVSEAIALYRGLPLYPAAELLEAQAAEGARSNMRAVFEAVAHRSPYPQEQFGANRWNHMVLKALFIDSPLHPIRGLDARANHALAQMLADYASERWAAGRTVSPELWRCLGPHANAFALHDLERVLMRGVDVERQAVALALAACSEPRARHLLARAPDLDRAIKRGMLDWDQLARTS